MLNILGMIILIIILFIIILLLLGIRISFEYVKKGSEMKGCLKILIFKKIKLYTHNFPSEDTDEDKDEEDEEKKQRDIKKIINLAKPCLGYFLDYLKKVIGAVSIKTMQNHLVFGLESYADTGKYIGIIWGLFSFINALDPKLKLSAEPSFAGTTIDCRGVNQLEIYPLKAVVPTIRLISKKEVRTFMRGVLDER